MLDTSSASLLGGCPHATLLGTFDRERVDRSRMAAVVDGNIYQVGRRDLAYFASERVLGADADLSLNAGATGPGDLCAHDDAVPDIDRLVEDHRVHHDSHHPFSGVSGGADAARGIRKLHQRAAVHVS